MACAHIGIISLVAFAALAGFCHGELAVRVDISKPRANIGDEVTVRCHVINQERQHFYIVWVKKVGTEETEIGSNRKMNQPFDQGDNPRYSAEVQFKEENDVADVTFILTIKNVSAADSGELGCKITKAGLEAFGNLVVLVPFSSLAISSRHMDGSHHVTYSNGQTIQFKEGEKRNFYCRAVGAYPRPEMTIDLNGEDIGNMFNTTVTKSQNGIPGLKEQSYDIEMGNPSLEIPYSFRNKNLTCTATVPGTDFVRTARVEIELTSYKPQFFCENEVVVALHTENVNLTCLVKAEPAINDSMTSYMWERKSEMNDTVSPGKMLGGTHAFLEKGKNDFERIMTLNIHHVFTQHFRTYYFKASNDIGTVEYHITLKRKETNYDVTTSESRPSYTNKERGDKDGNSASYITSSISLLLTIAFAFLLA